MNGDGWLWNRPNPFAQGSPGLPPNFLLRPSYVRFDVAQRCGLERSRADNARRVTGTPKRLQCPGNSRNLSSPARRWSVRNLLSLIDKDAKEACDSRILPPLRPGGVRPSNGTTDTPYRDRHEPIPTWTWSQEKSTPRPPFL